MTLQLQFLLRQTAIILLALGYALLSCFSGAYGFAIPPRDYCSSSRENYLYCKSTSQNNNGPSKSYRVGIVGAGAIAFGTASLVSSLGHDPMIWSPSGESTKDLLLDASSPVRSSVDEDTCLISPTIIRTSSIQSTGEISQRFNVRIATSPKDLIQYNDNNILVLALPVNGHKSVMEILAPYIVEKLMLDNKLQQQQKESGGVHTDEKNRMPIFHIIISSHASLGAVYFMKLLRQERTKYLQRMSDNHQSPTSQIIQQGETNNLDATCDDDIDMGIRITAWSTTTVTARKTSDTSVNVLTVREVVDYCTVPSTTIHSDEQS